MQKKGIIRFGLIFLISFYVNGVEINSKYQSTSVKNEYIVHFRHYYRASTRLKYISAVLSQANITWKLHQRDNVAANYPSDFEVLKILENDKCGVTELLEKHRAVKSISLQRSLRRVLRFENITERYHPKTNGHWNRRLHRAIPAQFTKLLDAPSLWELGVTGKGIKVAVFDTGLSKNHPHFRRVKERTNWTNEKTLDDTVSHGTFVAGVIASSRECFGLAPDADLHIYRVFTNSQVSYTSWFLDAFNYAIFKKINIINLSIGGPDFLDRPFVDKVLELSANKVIMVSAIGNDGPLYGTLNNPGDQSDVIGVGGLNFDGKVAKFSSRGMTTWELPYGYGRLKPDIVTYGSQVRGSNIHGGCRSLSGTSVASPVVAGALALILSGALNKINIINPSSVKQVLIEGATRLNNDNMFEQGHGKLNILKSMKILLQYDPKITLSPTYLDFKDNFMWPYSSQPLFCGGMPIIVNVTILNGIAVTGKINEKPKWYPYADEHGNLLNVSINYSPILWPWSGWMAISIAINEIGCDFKGVANGHISVSVESFLSKNGSLVLNTVQFPISVSIIPKPPRHKRILWDQYHSIKYPPRYIPRDNLKIKSDPLDWRGDHIHTNFRDMYNHLRNSGYYLDVLSQPYICINATEYGTLLLVDPEEEFSTEEITKLHIDVFDAGLSVIVFADWYNTTVMKKIKFFDENTRQWWIPDTGGSNIPALNDLLSPFGIGFSDFVGEGFFRLGDHEMYIASGSTISKMPEYFDNIIIGAELNDQGAEILEHTTTNGKNKYFVPILGLLQTNQTHREMYITKSLNNVENYHVENIMEEIDINSIVLEDQNIFVNKRVLLKVNSTEDVKDLTVLNSKKQAVKKIKNKLEEKNSDDHGGRIVIYGDSNCLDSTQLEKSCFWMLDAVLEFTMNAVKPQLLQKLNRFNEFRNISNTNPPLRLSRNSSYHSLKNVNTFKKSKKGFAGKCELTNWIQSSYTNTEKIKKVRIIVKENEDDDYIEFLRKKFLFNKIPGSDEESIKPNFKDISLETCAIFIAVLSFGLLFLFLNLFKRKISMYKYFQK